MRSLLVLTFFSLVILLGGSCKKHKTYPKSPPPSWAVDASGKYPATMTVVIRLPEKLQHLRAAEDQLAAFAGDECRGIGQVVGLGQDAVYFILIQGTSSEQTSVSFKYYGAANSRMYTTGTVLHFEADGNYGTADAPAVLNFDPVR